MPQSSSQKAGGGWTVQGLIDARMELHAHCHDCHHSEPLDLERVRDRLGPDAPAMASDLAPKLRCQRCGSSKAGLIYAPRTGAKGWPGRSG